ncbi:MAG: OmpA family protein [Desulfuromonadaceae bacterium]|nr:OmpA family protein [Desulfuromonadaceae bacterium]
MNKRVIAPVAAALLISATAAFGVEQKGQLSFAPVTGGYTYDGKQHLKAAPLYGARLGYNLTPDFGIEALIDYARTKGTKSTDNTTMYRIGTDVVLNLLPDSALVPFLALGVSGLSFDGSGQDKDFRAAWAYGAGFKYYLTDAIALRGDVRHIIYNHNATTLNNLEYIVGVHIPFGATKRSLKPAESTQNAPAPVPAKSVAVAASTEAPLIPAPAAALPAPNSPTRIVLPVLSSTADSDNDGVNDSLDRCPKTPPGVAVDAFGCPKNDRLAQKAETAKRFCDKPVVLTVSFDSGKAEIKPEFRDELVRIAYFLKEFPEARGTIEGYTDNVGNAAANTSLSQRRADTVRAYIINNFGIAPARIAAKGFGPDKPRETNKTAAGKAKNRRIEAVFTCN